MHRIVNLLTEIWAKNIIGETIDDKYGSDFMLLTAWAWKGKL